MRIETTDDASSGGGRCGECIHCTNLRGEVVMWETRKVNHDSPFEDMHVTVHGYIDVVCAFLIGQIALKVAHLGKKRAAIAGKVAVDLARLVAHMNDDDIGSLRARLCVTKRSVVGRPVVVVLVSRHQFYVALSPAVGGSVDCGR